MLKVIIFDIDGTLSESKQAMTPEMGEALGKLLEKMPVAVMSGADLPQFEKQFLPYLLHDANLTNLFLFPTSAAECLSYKEGKWQAEYDYLFSKEEKEKIIGALNSVALEEILRKKMASSGSKSILIFQQVKCSMSAMLYSRVATMRK
jgi:phosphomannomutase